MLLLKVCVIIRVKQHSSCYFSRGRVCLSSPAHKVQKAPESFDLLIIQGCYYNCTLIASLSHDIFGIL